MEVEVAPKEKKESVMGVVQKLIAKDLNDSERFSFNKLPLLVSINPASNTAMVSLSGPAYYSDADHRYYVLTAGHIQDETYDIVNIKAEFKNGQVTYMELLGYDSKLDVAVLGFNNPDFKFKGRVVKFGKSSEVQVANYVIALGAPMRIKETYSYGSVMNLKVGSDYPSNVYFNFDQKRLIMHNASIDAGSSGGPLLNSKGELIGINVMVAGRYSPKGLAVPIDDIKAILDDLKNGLKR